MTTGGAAGGPKGDAVGVNAVTEMAMRTVPVGNVMSRLSASLAANVMLLPRFEGGVPNLPLAETRVGNVFRDPSSTTIAWYLPTFELADDVDVSFAFAAKKSQEIDVEGNPYATATLTVGLKTAMPADAVAFQKQNPTFDVRAIPIEGLTALLALTARDDTTTAITTRTVTGTVVDTPKLHAQFSGLVGTNVLIAYGNLMEGGASITLTGSYRVAHRTMFRASQPGPGPVVVSHPMAMQSAMMMMRPGPDVPAVHAVAPEELLIHRVLPHPIPIVPVPPHPPAPPPVPTPHPIDPPPLRIGYVRSVESFSGQVALARKFAAVGYPRSFTVDDGHGPVVIASVNDLKDFNTQQSEFREFTALGDVSLKYPSFSRLYIGAISRVVVAVPAHYGIVRGVHGTDAVCQALVDASATGGDACWFQFTFTLAPVISTIELLQLAREVASLASTSDCTVSLPSQLDPKGGSTLTTLYQSAVTYSAGTAPHTFQLTVGVTDRDSTRPSVAVANQFIRQLGVATTPFLVGTMRVRLDDAYPTPVETSVVLNFQITAGSDEITVAATSSGVALTNESLLDLQMHRYALVSPSEIQVVAAERALPSKQEVVLSSSPASTDTQVVVDRGLSLSLPLTKTDLMRYLAFIVTDVQNVSYQLGVSAGSIDFAARHIAKIEVSITLRDLPQVNVPTFTLSGLDRSGQAQIFLPVQYAIGTLNGDATFTVHALDTTVAPVAFTLSNDFMSVPVIVVMSTSIPPFPTPSTPPTPPATDPTPPPPPVVPSTPPVTDPTSPPAPPPGGPDPAPATPNGPNPTPPTPNDPAPSPDPTPPDGPTAGSA